MMDQVGLAAPSEPWHDRFQDGAVTPLQIAAVIDAPHELTAGDDAAAPTATAELTGVGLVWLGTPSDILCVWHAGRGVLLSLSRALAQLRLTPGAPTEPPAYDVLGRISSSAPFLAVTAASSVGVIFTTSSDGGVACFSVPTELSRGGRAAELQPLWSRAIKPAHALLAACPELPLAASAARGQGAIALWRSGAASTTRSSLLELEWIRLPCPALSLSFRPDAGPSVLGRAAGSHAATLLAVCEDGSIRLWVDSDFASALPAAVLAAATAPSGAAASGRAMCMARVLAPPGPSVSPGSHMLASWASNDPAKGAAGRQRLQWLVVTVLHAPGAAMMASKRSAERDWGDEESDERDVEAYFAHAPPPDALHVWAVSVQSPERQTAGGAVQGFGIVPMPRVTAVLWGSDAQTVRPLFSCSPSHNT
jgi:hypothetical protein